jgi:hypothetical protein
VTPRVVAFVGPTLGAEVVRAYLPQAELRPPVAALDLLTLDVGPGDIVVLIDGYFFDRPAVRHKEITALLAEGIHVIGASSMGALRAAELHRQGMRGFGTVYRLFRLGILEGDDEVAVAHKPGDDGVYEPLTVALVDFRYSCRRAERSKALTRGDEDRLVAVAKSLAFDERRLENIVSLVANGNEKLRDTLRSVLREYWVDVKISDAIALFARLANGSVALGSASASVAPCHIETHYVDLWRQRVPLALEDTGAASRIDAFHACQYFSRDFGEFNARIALQTIAAWVMKQEGEYLSGMRSVDGRADGGPVDLHANAVLDDAEDRGVLARDDLNWAQPWFPEGLHRGASATEVVRTLVARCFTVDDGAPYRRSLIETLAKNGRLVHGAVLAATAEKLLLTITAKRPSLIGRRVSDGHIRSWFAARWGVVEGDMDREILDRGFMSVLSFYETATPFYLLDKYAGPVHPFSVQVHEFTT